MQQIKELLKAREKQLLKVKTEKENALMNTSKGERVRSKPELIIADVLKEEEIPYR